MNSKHAIRVILTERECVNRADKNMCNRDCANCDLVMKSETIKEAYTMAIEALTVFDAIHAQKVARHSFNGEMYISIKDIKSIERQAKESVYEDVEHRCKEWLNEFKPIDK